MSEFEPGDKVVFAAMRGDMPLLVDATVVRSISATWVRVEVNPESGADLPESWGWARPVVTDVRTNNLRKVQP